MNPRRILPPMGAALMLGALMVACERSATAPLEPAAALRPASVLSDVAPPKPAKSAKPTALLPCTKLPTYKLTQEIGAEGGTIIVGPDTLVIPAGALDRTVKITAESHTVWKWQTSLIKPPPGVKPSKDLVGTNTVRFKPHLTFAVPASLTMSYANCAAASTTTATIVYTNPVVNQIREIEPTTDDPDAKTATAQIKHFSNYAVAW